MPSYRNARAALLNLQFMAIKSPHLPSGSVARIKRNLDNREQIARFRSGQPLQEGPRKQKVKLVLLQGADEANVSKAVDRLRKDRPNIDFELMHEPEGELELCQETSAVIFVANGSNKRVDRFFNQSGDKFYEERIATVLVSEHDDDTDRFDHKMSFKHAIEEDKLDIALRAALYYKRGETLN